MESIYRPFKRNWDWMGGPIIFYSPNQRFLVVQDNSGKWSTFDLQDLNAGETGPLMIFNQVDTSDKAKIQENFFKY